METLVKDMLVLHEPECVAQVHAHQLEQDSRLQEPLEPTLDSVYADCIKCYTDWFQLLLDKFPVEDLMYTAARTEAPTKATTWQLASIPDSSTPLHVVSDILTACNLQCDGSSSAEWLPIIASVAACTVPQLIHKLQATADSDMFIQSLLPATDAITDLSLELQQHSNPSAVPPHYWRLIAVALQQDVYIIDVPNHRMCCYPAHNGPVAVHGAEKHWCIPSWAHPGYFFVLGKMPIPDSLPQAESAVFVLSDAATFQATTHMTGEGAAADTAKAQLDSLGIGFADLHFTAAGEPPANTLQVTWTYTSVSLLCVS